MVILRLNASTMLLSSRPSLRRLRMAFIHCMKFTKIKDDKSSTKSITEGKSRTCLDLVSNASVSKQECKNGLGEGDGRPRTGTIFCALHIPDRIFRKDDNAVSASLLPVPASPPPRYSLRLPPSLSLFSLIRRSRLSVVGV